MLPFAQRGYGMRVSNVLLWRLHYSRFCFGTAGVGRDPGARGTGFNVGSVVE